MGKGNNDFPNKAAKKFRGNLDDVATMSQEEVYRILDNDIDAIIEQVQKNRDHQGKFPAYMMNAFANLSVALWFNEYVHSNVKVTKKLKLKTEFSEDKIECLKILIFRAYKKSLSQFYANQTQEFTDRNLLLTDAFVTLDPAGYELTAKLSTSDNKLKKTQRRDLLLQTYGDPIHNIRYVVSIIDSSSKSDKKKMKVLKKLYGDRFVEAIGAAMTLNTTNSDFLSSAYDMIMKKRGNKKKTRKYRKPFIEAYAKAYKFNKNSYFRLKDEDFMKAIKPIAKKLKYSDIGYKKSFDNLESDGKSNKKLRDATKKYRE